MNEGVEKFIKMQKQLYVDSVKSNGYQHAKNLVGAPEAHTDTASSSVAQAILQGRTYDYVLEYGCGIGRLMRHICPNCYRVDGFDLSGEMLRFAKQYLDEYSIPSDKYTLQECDGYSLAGITTHKYNMVYSAFVLQHISVHEIRYNLLQEFYRVLRSGGYLFLQLNSGLEFNDNVQCVRYYQNYYNAPQTNSIWDLKMENPLYLVQEMTQLGFKNCNLTFYPVPNPENYTMAKAEYTVYIRANR